MGLVFDLAKGDTVANVQTQHMETENMRPILVGQQFQRLTDFGTGDDKFCLGYQANNNVDARQRNTSAPIIVVLLDVLLKTLDYLNLENDLQPT